MNQILPFYAFPRLLSYVAPAVYLLAAAGLMWLWRHRLIGLPATALMLAGLMGAYPGLYTGPRPLSEDYRPAIATIDELAIANDLVILDFQWQAGYFESYSRSGVQWWIAPGEA